MKSYIIIVGILGVIIASLISVDIVFQRTLQMEMAEQFNKQQLLLARAEATNIQDYVGKLKDDMLRITKFVSTFQISKEPLYAFLASGIFKDVETIKKGIKFLDGQGKILFTEGSLAAESPYDADLVDSLKKFCPGDAQITQYKKRVFIAAPVCRNDSIVKAVVVSIDIQDLAKEFLGTIKSGSRGYAWMMDNSGDLLYHPTQPDMVGRNLYKTDTSCFSCHKSFDTEKKIIEGKGEYYGKYVAPLGEDKVLAYSTASVGNSKWIVAISSPYSEVTGSMRRLTSFHSRIIILMLLSTSVVAVLLIFLNRKRVKAEELAKHRKDLERHAEDLEKKVDERTRELTAEKEKLNTVVSTIGSGIMLVDNHRNIQWVNQRMKDIVGKDITGMKCDDFFTDCTIINTYKVSDMQTDLLSNLFGQKDKFFQVTTAPVKGANEGVQGVIRLIHDVTEMKRMEEQMLHTEKLALLERLTASVAHEIGNPLTSVFSFVQMLKDKERDEFKKESLETIYLHMNRIADILNQLSGFSKTPQLELKRWKVGSLIADALSLIQYDTRVNDITIVRDLMPDMPEIITDRSQLSQVIVNIVVNAADAMPDGGTLTIRSHVENKNVILTFEDTGAGIPPEELKKIFDPFYTTKEKGTGLGLSLSHSIIEKLNGTLSVESEVNKGTKFIITLPMD